MNTFLFGAAVGVVATVIGGIILAAILGIWRMVWRYVASIFNDLSIASSAKKEGKYQEANTHENRAWWKYMGCLGAVLFLGSIVNVVVVIVVIVTAASNPTH